MSQKLIAPMPEDVDIEANWIVQITAISAVDGTLVNGVNVSNVALVAAPLVPSTADESLPPGPPPIFVPLDINAP